MNLLYAEIVTTFIENGMRFGKVRVNGAIKSVSVDLVKKAAPGDRVLLCDGVALGKVCPARADSQNNLKEINAHVSGNTW